MRALTLRAGEPLCLPLVSRKGLHGLLAIKAYGSSVQAIDLDARSLRCAGPDGVQGAPVGYDLLVGADGANSAVRGFLQVRPLLPCAQRDVRQPLSVCSHPALPYPTLMSCLCGLLAVACRFGVHGVISCCTIFGRLRSVGQARWWPIA